MANDNHLSSVTLYNVTMINSKYYNEFFELGQQKINFKFFELSLPDDDPVYTLKKVMEELDFTNLLAQYSNKGRNGFNPIMKYEEKKKLFEAVPKKYVSGESYDLLGKSLRLKVEANKEENVYTDGVYIFLKVKDKDDFRHKEIMMSKWLKQYQTTVFEELLQEKYLLFEKYGVTYPTLKIRNGKTFWKKFGFKGTGKFVIREKVE